MSKNSHSGRVGFYNQGNSCFVNASCQCLLHLPEVQYFLLTNYNEANLKDSKKVSVITSLVRILAEMYQTNHSAISLESLYPAIDSMASYLCDGLQHDSHELISFLLQGMEEELCNHNGNGSQMKNSFSLEDIVPTTTKQEWWDEYLKYHDDEITQLFYGYSIDTATCSNCNFSTFTLSAYNTIYVSLPLTHYKINVNLVYQYMNASTGEISLDVQFIHVKVAKKSYIQDVIDVINRRLRGTDCSIFPILGNYVSKKQFSYSTCNPGAYVETLLPSTNLQVLFLAYVIPKTQVDSHHLFIHSTCRIDDKPEAESMQYLILPFLLCFNEYSYEEYLLRTNYILHQFLNGNHPRKGKLTNSSTCLIPPHYLENNLFFCHSHVCSCVSTDFLYSLNIYECFETPFPKNIHSSAVKCNWRIEQEHYSIIVDWNQDSKYFKPDQAANVLRSFNISLTPVTISRAVKDGFSLTQGLQKELTVGSSKIHRFCENCEKQEDYYQTTQYGLFPPLLIIQLKRFQYSAQLVTVKRNGIIMKEKRYVKQKITDLIDFPVHDFNLSSFCENKEEEAIYDLYCVCNHYGTPDRGHYYSYCYDAITRKWYEYNDEQVKYIPEENIVTNKAYILFYRKRQPLLIEMENIRQLARSVPIDLPLDQSYTPSKWLDTDLEKDDSQSPSPAKQINNLTEQVVKQWTTIYSQPSKVGKQENGKIIVDIQGQKIATDKSKYGIMKSFTSSVFQSLFGKSDSSPVETQENSDIESRKPMVENQNACIQALIVRNRDNKEDLHNRSELIEKAHHQTNYICCCVSVSGYWCFLFCMIVIILTILYMIIFL